MGRLPALRWWAGLALLFGVALVLAWVVPLPARLSVPASRVLTWRDGTAAHISLAPDDRWRIAVTLDEVDPDYVAALLAFEDARFRWHPGVDPLALTRAIGQNLRAGHVVSGASTLTMQIVRMVEPRPRTLRSKGIEALRAVQLELRLGKNEVLEAYLRFLPFGRNVEGVQAACWTYFGHDARDLSATEIATLLAVPQDPTHRYPRPDHAEALRKARDHVATVLADKGALPVPSGQQSGEVLSQIIATPVPARMRSVPRRIPHVAAWARGPGAVQPTTLDRGVQALVERVLERVRPDAERDGIHNASVVVVDHASAEVRAMVGSWDFWDAEHGGQIAGFATPRSPGSTLKPFLYARAIDLGLVLPDQLVADVPVHYGAYAPNNFDGRFDGMVSMEDALSRSLNVPFIDLLARVGTEPFLGLLRSAGVRSLDPRPGHYGLSVIAGGVEITPMELAGMFTALAEGGRYRLLRWYPGPDSPPLQLWSEGATWLTRRALRIKDRPDFPERAQLSALPRGIHWKTGTSFGFRDAWAVGSGRRYTVVVWMGNFDNRPSRHLVGAVAAGPVLFDILEGLDDGLGGAPPPPPEDLAPVKLCALSGLLPGDTCPRTQVALAPKAHMPTSRCTLHQQFEIDDATGLAVLPGCRAGRHTHEQRAVVWPVRVRRWMESARPPPTLDPACRDRAPGDAPEILTPAVGMVAMLIPGVSPTDQEIPLQAAHGTGTLTWFVDGEQVGRGTATERLWWVPSAGEHEIMVMDAAGRLDRVRLVVRG